MSPDHDRRAVDHPDPHCYPEPTSQAFPGLTIRRLATPPTLSVQISVPARGAWTRLRCRLASRCHEARLCRLRWHRRYGQSGRGNGLSRVQSERRRICDAPVQGALVANATDAHRCLSIEGAMASDLVACGASLDLTTRALPPGSVRGCCLLEHLFCSVATRSIGSQSGSTPASKPTYWRGAPRSSQSGSDASRQCIPPHFNKKLSQPGWWRGEVCEAG